MRAEAGEGHGFGWTAPLRNHSGMILTNVLVVRRTSDCRGLSEIALLLLEDDLAVFVMGWASALALPLSLHGFVCEEWAVRDPLQ